jgi:DNA repair protein RadC
LSAIKGVGEAKAAQLKAGLEIGRRLLIAAPHERPQITSPADAANLLMLEMGHLEQEHLRVLLLDTKNQILASPVSGDSTQQHGPHHGPQPPIRRSHALA